MSNPSQWSTSAASNNASPPDGFPEQQSPSSLNDACRELMAGIARWYAGTDGSLETSGSGNSYVLTTGSSHAALADIPLLVFRLDRANTAAATLNVDGLGAKSMRLNGSALVSGQLVANTVICAAYNATDDVFEVFGPVVDASQLTGELPDARLSANVALYDGDMSQFTVGDLADARLSANVPLIDAANEFTSATGLSYSLAGTAEYRVTITDAVLDEKLWGVRVSSDGTWRVAVRSDAGSLVESPLVITRTGTNVDSVAIAGDAITLTGAVDITGALTGDAATFSGNISMTGTRSIDATTRLNLTGATVSVGESGGNLGFFGDAGAAKPTVTGTVNDSVLIDLLTSLDGLGLITNSTTPP